MIVESTRSKRAVRSWKSERCVRPQTHFRVLDRRQRAECAGNRTSPSTEKETVLQGLCHAQPVAPSWIPGLICEEGHLSIKGRRWRLNTFPEKVLSHTGTCALFSFVPWMQWGRSRPSPGLVRLCLIQLHPERSRRVQKCREVGPPRCHGSLAPKVLQRHLKQCRSFAGQWRRCRWGMVGRSCGDTTQTLGGACPCQEHRWAAMCSGS